MYEDAPVLTALGVRLTRAVWALGTFLGVGFVIVGLR